jgi:membrane fusion protein (multidrug efflux system)
MTTIAEPNRETEPKSDVPALAPSTKQDPVGAADGQLKPTAPSAAPESSPPLTAPRTHAWRMWLYLGVGIVGLAIGTYWLIPLVHTSLNTVSTDDAYVNGHVTFVAPRVAGQVRRVLVDDNVRVKKGDLLVEVDKEPYQVQVTISEAAVVTAQADLLTAQALTRGLIGQTRSMRFQLEHAIEDVNNHIALLRSKFATLQSQKASLAKAQSDYDRTLSLSKSGSVTKEELDLRKESLLVAQARVEEALQGVYQIRVSLGLPPKPETGDDLTQVPPELDQKFSSVRQAQAGLIQSASQLGVIDSFDKSPKQMVADFYKRDPEGNIDRIYAQLLKEAPAVKQAEAKLAHAERSLDEAKLNLRYCDVVAEIDGVVTRRNVNPGNNVQAGQSLMAVRSVTEIWIDANFKETQLADLRIGQRVVCEFDMYGRRREYEGRITGFTMGTGQTLALLPPQNATGNFVKIVQRLPVRIELTNYTPGEAPLFVGLSVTPYVYFKESPSGPNAGGFLQAAGNP